MRKPAAPKRRRWQQTISIATVVGTLAIGTGVASAGGGGIASPGEPVVSDLICISKCAGLRDATVGSRIRVSGHNLSAVGAVVFPGSNGPISARPTAVEERSVEAKVPDGATTGRLRVATAYGARATTPTELRIVSPAAVPRAGEFQLGAAEAKPHKTFYDARRAPRFQYMFHGSDATDVVVEVTRARSGEVVATLEDRNAEPNTEQVVRWNGRDSNGKLARNGRYRFRIVNAAPRAARRVGGHTGFGFYRYRFPIQARHQYGDGFGAGRGHQGQDVFARCGTPLRAVRGGRVQWNRYHSAAGNYLVIDAKGTGQDHMYAHLLRRSPLKQGERVRTGQVIGRVGETGNASGCHLHFEIWSAPGWYEGGRPLPSVQRKLKAWDRWS